ncbi:hypothetical protein Ccrd_005746 [Cynara cardunculus var. scolymus]|uniref:Uncharacterized protein n=1 Tax=Cynara cardunculus var. scolymus TaxID=59895 RepID=A0A103XKF2_CYNCS|nr:hypothetical protein Ccrd_005746 [Cynara cardunculus var. scolymus]
MISSLNLRRISCPSVKYDYGQHFSGNAVTLSSSNLRRRRLHNRCLASLSTNSSNSSSFRPSVASSTTFTTSVGSPPPIPPLTQWNLTQRHIIVLNFIACAGGLRSENILLVDIYEDQVLFSSQPSILFYYRLSIFPCNVWEIKRQWLYKAYPIFVAGSDVEGQKFMPYLISLDALRVKAKNCFLNAAISATWLFCSAIPTLLAFKRAAESLEKLLDVTREELPDTMAAVRLSGMEISDLTMELTSVQMVVPMTSEPAAGPVVARTARGIRETIVKSRAFMQMFFTITQFSKVAFKYLTSRAKSNA